MDTKLQKALEKNGFIHKYIIAIDHALLWVAALSFAAVLITCGNRRITGTGETVELLHMWNQPTNQRNNNTGQGSCTELK